MTQENYKYRTCPLFLRNSFYGVGNYDIPVMPKFEGNESDFTDLRLIGFDKIKGDKGKHHNRIVHFFLYDYKFEKIWDSPKKSIKELMPYRAMLTPDFSMYTEMHYMQQLYNTFRNRWCGAFFASRGLRVIPTINWGLENSFDFCFAGIPKGSTVAISTYMWQKHDNKPAQNKEFMAGYKEMLRQIEPEKILCYHTPFKEMSGNIVHIDYDLSSWRHMNDN